MANFTSFPSLGASHIIDNRISGLQFLLRYALHHEHSRRWIAAIRNLLARQEVRHA
jgi:hypothetical protein